MKKLNRVGETGTSNKGEKMVVVEYNNTKNIIVEFKNKNGTVRIASDYNSFKNGNIKNPYFPIIYNFGFLGVGKYRPGINDRNRKRYKTWVNMLRRSYDPKYHKSNPAYKCVLTCKEWHNFQNFAKWYDENYYEIDGHSIELDKDILIKGNKIYSQNTCVFVPRSINNLFVKVDSRRGNYSIGVYKQCNRFIARCDNQLIKKRTHLGSYYSELEAFNVYKAYKENHIKEVADHYKDQIPTRLYEAMYSYKVEITD